MILCAETDLWLNNIGEARSEAEVVAAMKSDHAEEGTPEMTTSFLHQVCNRRSNSEIAPGQPCDAQDRLLLFVNAQAVALSKPDNAHR